MNVFFKVIIFTIVIQLSTVSACEQSKVVTESSFENLISDVEKFNQISLITIDPTVNLECSSLACLRSKIKKFPIVLNRKLKKYNKKIQFFFLYRIVQEFSKIPKKIISDLKKRRSYVEFTILGDSRLIPPRDWPVNIPVVALAGEKKALIAIDSLDKGHASENVILHEVFHLWDSIHRNKISLGRKFTNIHRRESWYFSSKKEKNYYLKYPDEALAEAFANYYSSDDLKLQFQESNPLTAKYMDRLKLN